MEREDRERLVRVLDEVFLAALVLAILGAKIAECMIL